MATAKPRRVATFIEKMDMLAAWPSRYIAPRVTVTASPPVITGSAADTKLPKTTMRAISATGRPYTSTRCRSVNEWSVRSRLTAGSPVTYASSSVPRSDSRMISTSFCTVAMEASKLSTATELLRSSEISWGFPVLA